MQLGDRVGCPFESCQPTLECNPVLGKLDLLLLQASSSARISRGLRLRFRPAKYAAARCRH